MVEVTYINNYPIILKNGIPYTGKLRGILDTLDKEGKIDLLKKLDITQNIKGIKLKDGEGVIYLWVNLLNANVYVGQVMFTENRKNQRKMEDALDVLAYRSEQHEHASCTDKATQFEEELHNTGINNFIVFPIRLVHSYEESNELEKYYIYSIGTFIDDGKGYNSSTGGGNKRVSKKTREKQSEAKKGANHPRSKMVKLYDGQKEEWITFQCCEQIVEYILSTYNARISRAGITQIIKKEGETHLFKRIHRDNNLVFFAYYEKDDYETMLDADLAELNSGNPYKKVGRKRKEKMKVTRGDLFKQGNYYA